MIVRISSWTRRHSAAALVSFAAAASSLHSAAPARRAPSAGDSLVSLIMVEPIATDVLRPAERTFLERAAELSRQQTQLARVAVSQAASSDVRTYAQLVASDHRQISDSLDALRRKRGVSGSSGSVDPAPASYPGLADKSGADFDREFVRISAELQNGLLRLFEEVMADAKDPEIREFVGGSLPVLREHQNRATELKKAYD